MYFEVNSWNLDKAAEVINCLLPGKNVCLDNNILLGAEKVSIEKEEIMNSEPCPEDGYDGGIRSQIRIQFEMKGGGMITRTFEPIDEVCRVCMEDDDLLIIEFISLVDYVKKMKSDLDERIAEHEEFYSK
jgi:hypothetical protein